MFTVSSTPLYVRNSYNSIKKKENLIEKMDKNMNRQFTRKKYRWPINICKDVYPH